MLLGLGAVVWQVDSNLWNFVDLLHHIFDCDMLKFLHVEVRNVVVLEILLLASQDVTQEVNRAVALWRQKQLACRNQLRFQIKLTDVAQSVVQTSLRCRKVN